MTKHHSFLVCEKMVLIYVSFPHEWIDCLDIWSFNSSRHMFHSTVEPRMLNIHCCFIQIKPIAMMRNEVSLYVGYNVVETAIVSRRLFLLINLRAELVSWWAYREGNRRYCDKVGQRHLRYRSHYRWHTFSSSPRRLISCYAEALSQAEEDRLINRWMK